MRLVMQKTITTFLTAEDGIVTVDWVVLTAALAGLGLAVMGVVSSAMENTPADESTRLETGHVQISKDDGMKSPTGD